MEHVVLCYDVRDKGTADRPGPQLLQKPRQIAGERPRRKSELLRAAGKAVQAGTAAVCPGQLTESGLRRGMPRNARSTLRQAPAAVQIL